MQHAFRTTVLGLSQFKCAANFDVIFFPSHCLKPLAFFIIPALWSEQHGNNVSRRHTPSDGPLTALRHSFLSFLLLSFLSFPLSSLVSFLLSQYSRFRHPLSASLSPFISLQLFGISPFSSLFSLCSHQPFVSSFLFIYLLSLYSPSDHSFPSLPLILFLSFPCVWPLINNSPVNWSLISGWLTQGDHNNEDTDNGNRKPLSAPNTDAMTWVY